MKSKLFSLAALVITCSFFLACDKTSAGGPSGNEAAVAPAKLQAAATRPIITLPQCQAYSPEDPNVLAEIELRNYISNCTGFLWAARDYKSLDAMIANLRGNKTRSSSGLWLQGSYYAGFEKLADKARSEEQFDQYEAELSSWIAADKSSDAARLALSTFMIKRAWFYRGHGYGSTVSEGAFAKFYAQVSKTKKFLLENENISTRDPEWFTQLFMVMMVEKDINEEKFRIYFDKAVKLYPDYFPIYFTAASFYLPKWHGSNAEFDQFVKYAIKSASPGQASATYARIYWANVCTICGSNDVTDWRDHWNELMVGFDKVIEDYPDQWNINNYARIACTAYDQDKTLEVMKKIKGDPIPGAWDKEQFTYEYCADWSGLSD